MRCPCARREGHSCSVWAEGPSVRSAQGIALGNRTRKAIPRANGPTVRRENCWPVGPLAESDGPVPQGDALGWENRCPVGAAMAPRNLRNTNGHTTMTVESIVLAAHTACAYYNYSSPARARPGGQAAEQEHEADQADDRASEGQDAREHCQASHHHQHERAAAPGEPAEAPLPQQ
jgi:hypothetical protein